jgi:uncharacterized protein YbgA (DUF1722 family)
MMNKNTSEAIVDWLEEIPIDELSDENAQEIVKQYRIGSLPINEAIVLLEEDCYQSMSDWVDMNEKYKNMFE